MILVRLHVEAKEDIPLFVDEFTEAELFRQLKATPGHKAIIGKEEASHFLIVTGRVTREKQDWRWKVDPAV